MAYAGSNNSTPLLTCSLSAPSREQALDGLAPAASNVGLAPDASNVLSFALRRDTSIEAAPEAVDDAPHSCCFTGRHDDGALPPPPKGFYAHLLDAVVEAKALTDAHVLSILPVKKGAASASAPSGGAASSAPLQKV